MGRTSEGSLRANVIDPCLCETDPRAEPAQELIGLRKREQSRHNLPVHQRKVARVERHWHLGNTTKDPVECPSQQRQEHRTFALRSPPVDNVISLLPLRVESNNQLGWVLQVAVEENNGVTRG